MSEMARLLDILTPTAPLVEPVYIRLPLPPSINHAYEPRKGGGRRIGDKLEAFKQESAIEIKSRQRIVWPFKPRTKLHVRIKIYIPEGDVNRIDADNLIKFIQDAVAQTLRFNDVWVRDCHFTKYPTQGAGYVETWWSEYQ